jgi:hypothetical protein
MNLIYPMFAMFGLTVAVLVVMFRSRVRAVRSSDVSLSFFKTYQGDVPEYIVTPARHFTNLFETPVLFYVACLASMILQHSGVTVVMLAWGYVLSRCAHAYVHLGTNNVMVRMRAYFVSWLLLGALWVSLLI